MKRKNFLKQTGITISGAILVPTILPSSVWGKIVINNKKNDNIARIVTNDAVFRQSDVHSGLRVGMIGLDTSHCIAYTKTLNAANADTDFDGFKVTVAWPTLGSSDLPASINRLAGFIEQVKQQGVEIVDSIEELLEKVDVVLLETVDGRKHIEQALPVIKAGKRLFIDKPMTASLSDALVIFNAAHHYNVPVFSSSSLRYITGMDEVKNGSLGEITGAITYSPATIEKTHPDLFWYAIHGVEILFAAMGKGCKTVSRISTADTDVVTGVWENNRIATFRGIRAGKKGYGGTVFSEKKIKLLGPYIGYNPLLKKIIEFFKTGIVPVEPEETLDILAFMETADESKKRGGIPVSVEEIMEKANNEIKGRQDY
jgi:hypothetical protein